MVQRLNGAFRAKLFVHGSYGEVSRAALVVRAAAALLLLEAAATARVTRVVSP